MTYSMHVLGSIPRRVLRDGYTDPHELEAFVPVYEQQDIPVVIVNNDTGEVLYITEDTETERVTATYEVTVTVHEDNPSPTETDIREAIRTIGFVDDAEVTRL